VASVTDQINHCRVADVVPAAYSVIDAIDGNKPGIQAAGAALTFFAICKHYEADPRDVLVTVERFIRHAEQQEAPTMRALWAYLAGEL